MLLESSVLTLHGTVNELQSYPKKRIIYLAFLYKPDFILLFNVISKTQNSNPKPVLQK